MFRLVAFLLVLPACSCVSPSPAQPKPPAEEDFVFVYLKTGPHSAEKSKEESQTIFKGHMANIQRLAEAGKLDIAGPFDNPNHDKSQRGIFVFDVRTVDEARALTETDPGIQSGVFVLEAYPLRVSPVIRHIMDFEREKKAAAAREGRTLTMSQNVRGYMMVLAKDARRADAALADLEKQGKVMWSGHFGGSMAGQGVYVVDAATVADSEALLGPVREKIGECFVDSWWSSPSLEKLPALRATAH